MKKLILFQTLILIGFSSILSAQINDKIYGKPEDFKQMQKRTLVVELLQEDPKTIEKLSKKEKTANDLKEYKAFIIHYNELIEASVKKYWKFNDKIEYKTSNEVTKLFESKSTKHVVLSYFELNDSGGELVERSGLTVPALRFHRTEMKVKSPDYKIYLPSSFIRADNKYLECDFKFALNCMQNNINWIIKNNKTLNFEDYCKTIAKLNCSKLANLKLLVEKDFLYKNVTEQEAKGAYKKNIEFVSAEDLNKSYLSQTTGEAVLFSIPFGIIKGSMGPVKSSALAFIKVIIDSQTDEILYIHIPGIGKSYVYQILKNEFENYSECKL